MLKTISMQEQPVRKRPLEKMGKALVPTDTVAKQFRPLIVLLSTISPYGIAFKIQAEESPGAHAAIIYEVSQFSWTLPLRLYSIGLLLWIVFCFCIQIFNASLDVPFPIDLVTLKPASNTSGEVTFLLSTNRLASAFISLCRIFEFVGLFLTAPLLVQWLNELTAIETEFNKSFSRIGMRSTVNVTRLRNILIAFYLVLLGASWTAGNYVTFLSQFHFNPRYNALGHIWFLSFVIILIVSELLEDVKIILMLEILRRIYLQIRSAIRQEIYQEEIKEGNVVAWDALMTRLRRHVKLTGGCFKTQLMLNICETVFVVSVGTYLIIRSAGEDDPYANLHFAVSAFFHCFFMATRLYAKVTIAESIYAEERLLVDDLKDSELRVRVDSLEALNELRNLQRSLNYVSARVHIGSYFNLDSKLLVQVVIQTIPMVIAVAQFRN